MRRSRHALGERALRAGLLAFLVFASAARAEPTARFSDAPPATSGPAAPPGTARAKPPAPAPVPSAPAAASRAEDAPPRPAAAPPAQSTTPLSGSALFVERGARFSAAGKVIDAIDAYSEAIRLDPRNGDALLALGKLRVGLGEPAEAEMLFTAATRIGTVAAAAYAERARLRKAQGRDALAMEDLERAAELSPDDVARAEELSALHVARRAWLPALAIWRRAAASAPDPQSEHRAVVQARALAVLAGTLDCVRAGGTADHTWTRRALARIGK